jgi:GTP-binding protein EngB required for normal cell division
MGTSNSPNYGLRHEFIYGNNTMINSNQISAFQINNCNGLQFINQFINKKDINFNEISAFQINNCNGLQFINKKDINFNEISIYVYNNKRIIKTIEESLKENFPEYKLRFYYLNGLNSIFNEIEKKFYYNYSRHNIILEIKEENEDRNINIEIKQISEFLMGWRMFPIIRPKFILSIKENKKMPGNLGNSDISNEYIELVYYKDEFTPLEIIEKIKHLYRYYNNIGDTYSIINELLGQPEISKNEDENDVKYRNTATFNILVIGRSGVGKSTLINLLLNEEKAQTGSKFSEPSKTKLFSRYIHQEYPITFIDTPGIEETEDILNMINYLVSTKKLYGDGKKKIHTVLYVINSAIERVFYNAEIYLIDFINRIMEIQIFFVCTRAGNERNAFNINEYIKINLKQAFGFTHLLEFIYPCQLLDEEDGKRFGIDILLNGIYNFYSKEKEKLEIIKAYIKGSYSDVPFPDKTIILSSLKGPYDFQKYLNDFCDYIINNYVELIKKEEIHNYNISIHTARERGAEDKRIKNIKNIKKTKKLLIKHLAYELNGDSSKEEIKSLFFFQIGIRTNEIGHRAKNIFLKNLQQNSNHQNQHDGLKNMISEDQSKIQNNNSKTENDKMREAINNYFIHFIDNYISAIDSLKYLYKKK